MGFRKLGKAYHRSWPLETHAALARELLSLECFSSGENFGDGWGPQVLMISRFRARVVAVYRA